MDRCGKCFHNEVCDQTSMLIWHTMGGREECSYFTDKSKVMEVPCKIGDTVYWNSGLFIHEFEVKGFFFDALGKISRLDLGDIQPVLNHEALFFDKENAEQALKEGVGNG